MDSRINVSTQCQRCKHNVHNAKRHAKRQEDNKKERMDAQSRIPFSALFDNEWKQRLLVLNTGQKVQSRKLQRALDKINEKEDEIRVSKEMYEHMKVAAEAFVNKYNSISTEESIWVLIDKIVAKSPYDENDPISRQDAEVFVKTMDSSEMLNISSSWQRSKDTSNINALSS